MIDFSNYFDTDSLFLMAEDFIVSNLKDPNRWYSKSDDEKTEIVKKIGVISETYVNDYLKNFVQPEIYNSIEQDFFINFQIEKIVKSGLFIKKKRYALYCKEIDGFPSNKIIVKGLEIVRSDTPLIFKTALSSILEMILKGSTDNEISKKVCHYKKVARELPVEEISSNIGVNGIKKYINDDNSYGKGAPYHVKGVANYRSILNKLKIEKKYPKLDEGEKVKVVYIKNNPYGMETISYKKWPKEFHKANIIPDKEKMIDKYFLLKIEYLLTPANRKHILDNQNSNTSLFFN